MGSIARYGIGGRFIKTFGKAYVKSFSSDHKELIYLMGKPYLDMHDGEEVVRMFFPLRKVGSTEEELVLMSTDVIFDPETDDSYNEDTIERICYRTGMKRDQVYNLLKKADL